MLEFAVLLLIAAGGLVILARRWQHDQRGGQVALDPGWRILSTISPGGLYSLAAPAEVPRRVAFRDLHLASDGLALTDSRSGQLIAFRFAAIQWISAVETQNGIVPALSIHLESERRWRILWLQMPEAEMLLLVRLLQQTVPPARSNLGRTAQQPLGPIAARTVTETLQGALELTAEVQLYLLPQVLVVLQDDFVQAKIDLSTIRRVLAVERGGGLLQRGTPDGLIRLYSRYETAVFALAQYQQIAQEISFLARCPLETITQTDKDQKE